MTMPDMAWLWKSCLFKRGGQKASPEVALRERLGLRSSYRLTQSNSAWAGRTWPAGNPQASLSLCGLSQWLLQYDGHRVDFLYGSSGCHQYLEMGRGQGRQGGREREPERAHMCQADAVLTFMTQLWKSQASHS